MIGVISPKSSLGRPKKKIFSSLVAHFWDTSNQTSGTCGIYFKVHSGSLPFLRDTGDYIMTQRTRNYSLVLISAN